MAPRTLGHVPLGAGGDPHQLIDRRGKPRFVRLDVEGFEDKALAGLSRPLRALSFEFTIIAQSLAAIALLAATNSGPTVSMPLSAELSAWFSLTGAMSKLWRAGLGCRTAPTLAIFMLSSEGAASGLLAVRLEDDLTGVGTLRRVRNPLRSHRSCCGVARISRQATELTGGRGGLSLPS